MQNKKNKIDTSSLEIEEDSTKYGEFISSYFKWNTLEEQKQKAKKLENISKNKKYQK